MTYPYIVSVKSPGALLYGGERSISAVSLIAAAVEFGRSVPGIPVGSRLLVRYDGVGGGTADTFLVKARGDGRRYVLRDSASAAFRQSEDVDEEAVSLVTVKVRCKSIDAQGVLALLVDSARPNAVAPIQSEVTSA